MNRADLILFIALGSVVIIVLVFSLFLKYFKFNRVKKLTSLINDSILGQRYLRENELFKSAIEILSQIDVEKNSLGKIRNSFAEHRNWFEIEIRDLINEVDKASKFKHDFGYHKYLYFLYVLYKKLISYKGDNYRLLLSILKEAKTLQSWIEITDMLLDEDVNFLRDFAGVETVITLWKESLESIRENEFIIMNMHELLSKSRKQIDSEDGNALNSWHRMARLVKEELLSIKMKYASNAELVETIDDCISEINWHLEG